MIFRKKHTRIVKSRGMVRITRRPSSSKGGAESTVEVQESSSLLSATFGSNWEARLINLYISVQYQSVNLPDVLTFDFPAPVGPITLCDRRISGHNSSNEKSFKLMQLIHPYSQGPMSNSVSDVLIQWWNFFNLSARRSLRDFHEISKF